MCNSNADLIKFFTRKLPKELQNSQDMEWEIKKTHDLSASVVINKMEKYNILWDNNEWNVISVKK